MSRLPSAVFIIARLSPDVSVRNPQVFLNAKRARHFNGYHPWVMEHAVVPPAAELPAGQIVDFHFPDGRWIGRGVYNPHSRIRLRLYQWDQAAQLDQAWVESQLQRAVALRRTWMDRHGALDAVRWVNSEGDGLSGLVVDQFGPYLVVQVTAYGILQWLEPITAWLVAELKPAGILLRMDQRTSASEGLEARDETLYGQAPSELISLNEHGVRLQVDLPSGQKTGYYLDQRTNRYRAAQWMGNGPLLDVCCYVGGFSLLAAKVAKPATIVAVDSSARALQLAAQNAELNGVDNIEFVQADCFDYLEALVAQSRRFHSVVLDPPRMAGNRAQLQAALRAYYRLNLSAVNLLEPGGTLVTCSCSGRVTRSDFIGMLAAVAKRARRSIQILEMSGADFDHPIDVNCPETEYLKCFACRVT